MKHSSFSFVFVVIFRCQTPNIYIFVNLLKKNLQLRFQEFKFTGKAGESMQAFHLVSSIDQYRKEVHAARR